MLDYCETPQQLIDMLSRIVEDRDDLLKKFDEARKGDALTYFMGWHGHELYELTVHAEIALGLAMWCETGGGLTLVGDGWYAQVQRDAMMYSMQEMRVASRSSLQSANLVEDCKRSFWVKMMRATIKDR